MLYEALNAQCKSASGVRESHRVGLRGLNRCVVGIKTRHSRARARTIAACIDFRFTCACPCAGAAGITTAVSVDFFDFSLEYKYDLGVYDWLLCELRKRISSEFLSVKSLRIGGRLRVREGRVHRCGPCTVRALVRVSVLCVVFSVSISWL